MSYRSPLPNDPIKQFMEAYKTSQPYYERLAKAAAKKCEEAVKTENGIDCNVSWRAKTPESLETKLRTRQEKGHAVYNDQQNILNDILDIAGVRIALYWPKERERVEKILDETFEFNGLDTRHITEAPNTEQVVGNIEGHTFVRRFTGYSASHYIVSLKQADSVKAKVRDDRVEIQVLSVLRNAWAQVEHDIVYKQVLGPPSWDQYHVIDGLGGAIHMGECFLDQLWDIRERQKEVVKIPFRDIYDLGSFVCQWLEGAATVTDSVGSLQALKALLENADLDGEQVLKPVVDKLKADLHLQTGGTKAVYGGMKLSPAIYLMHYVYWSPEFKPKKEWNMMKSMPARPTEKYMFKLRVILSTFIWLREFFPLSEWEETLLSTGSEVPLGDLCWLGKKRVQELATSSDEVALDPAEMETLENLWRWFLNHPEPSIRLTFGIASMNILRDARTEWHLFHRSFMWPNELVSSALNRQ
jgi:ppGpp synthetase/RelA/SpoT-type nucleotidyltranferase